MTKNAASGFVCARGVKAVRPFKETVVHYKLRQLPFHLDVSMEETQFMKVMTWLQDSSIAIWVAESETIWAYPTMLTLHTFGLAILVGSNAVIDFRLLGFSRETPIPPLKKLFGPMWIALAINAITGVLLFMSGARVKGLVIMLYVKLTFVVLALIVLLQIRRIVFDSETRPEVATLPRASWLAALSLCLWAAATLSGRMMAYWDWSFGEY